MFTRNWNAWSVSPRLPISNPESSPRISMVGPSSVVPDELMMAISEDFIRDNSWLTTTSASEAKPSPLDSLVTRTLAASAPIPKIPARPWLMISTATSSRSASSSLRASSRASSIVLALICISFIINCLLVWWRIWVFLLFFTGRGSPSSL